MKITIETDGSVTDLKADLEEALLTEREREWLESIEAGIVGLKDQRDVMLRGVQQCADAVSSMARRIPRKYSIQEEICSKTEELVDLIEHDINWVVADDDRPTKGRELNILVNDIRALIVELKEEP